MKNMTKTCVPRSATQWAEPSIYCWHLWIPKLEDVINDNDHTGEHCCCCFVLSLFCCCHCCCDTINVVFIYLIAALYLMLLLWWLLLCLLLFAVAIFILSLLFWFLLCCCCCCCDYSLLSWHLNANAGPVLFLSCQQFPPGTSASASASTPSLSYLRIVYQWAILWQAILRVICWQVCHNHHHH